MSADTLYQRAKSEMREITRNLLQLSADTAGFTNPSDEIWQNETAHRFLLTGLGYPRQSIPELTNGKDAWLARSAQTFNIELAATSALYERLEPFIVEMIAKAYGETHDFSDVNSEWIREQQSSSSANACCGHIQQTSFVCANRFCERQENISSRQREVCRGHK